MTIKEAEKWKFGNLLTELGFEFKIENKASGYKITLWVKRDQLSPKALYFRHPSNLAGVPLNENYVLGMMLRLIISVRLGFKIGEKIFTDLDNPDNPGAPIYKTFKHGLDPDPDYDDFIRGTLYK